MNVAFAGSPPTAAVAALAEAIRRRLPERGDVVSESAEGARLVFNLADAADPRVAWGRGTHQFTVSLLALREGTIPQEGGRLACAPSDVLAAAYPALLKTLSNAVVTVDGGGLTLVTPEMGVRPLPGRPEDAVLDAVLPLAGARFAVENVATEDLGPLATDSAARVEELKAGGRRLAGLGLLPAVVSVEAFLDAESRRLLQALFGIQQVSYGNLSIREPGAGFWMTGRGVDKGRLETIGRDVMLVTGTDEDLGSVLVRVPPGCGAARVSVDALEHGLLYRSFPAIGAIVHVHAWMEGIESTPQNYPCGTVELARDVVALVGRQPDPSRTIVGLRNHGVTVTGPTMSDIFARIEGRLVSEIPPT